MNKNEKVLEIVNDVINDRLTQLIEEMSTNEFVEMIGDMYKDQTGKDVDEGEDEDFDQQEFVSEIVGSRVVPLLHKISEYVIGVDIPIK
jgi:gamma-glutamyl phosphate reductase